MNRFFNSHCVKPGSIPVPQMYNLLCHESKLFTDLVQLNHKPARIILTLDWEIQIFSRYPKSVFEKIVQNSLRTNRLLEGKHKQETVARGDCHSQGARKEGRRRRRKEKRWRRFQRFLYAPIYTLLHGDPLTQLSWTQTIINTYPNFQFKH